MYSWEIQKMLEEHNYSLPPDVYMDICQSSKQIIHVKYKPYENKFCIWTDDDYYWEFEVLKHSEQ